MDGGSEEGRKEVWWRGRERGRDIEFLANKTSSRSNSMSHRQFIEGDKTAQDGEHSEEPIRNVMFKRRKDRNRKDR